MIAFYSLSPEPLRTMVLMRKDILYECVKRNVMKSKEDPFAFFTPSLRKRKFNFSCCDTLLILLDLLVWIMGLISKRLHGRMAPIFLRFGRKLCTLAEFNVSLFQSRR